MADSSFYFSVLYPFQDDVLRLVREAKTGFHLTGGTALSRGYLKHRFSDDLDLFVNFDAHFGEWSNRVIDTFWRLGDWKTEVILREEYFVRAVLTRGEDILKVEMVNDVGSRVGDVRDHPVLGPLLSSGGKSPATSPTCGDSVRLWAFRSTRRYSVRRASLPAFTQLTSREGFAARPLRIGKRCRGSSLLLILNGISRSCRPWASG